MRCHLLFLSVALVDAIVGNAGAVELDWRTEMKTRIVQQGNFAGKLEAECLRIRVSASMLAMKTREELQQRLDMLAPNYDDNSFDALARDILLNSEGYDQPYADVRLVISPFESFEEKIVPRGSRPPLVEKQTVRPGVTVTTRSAGDRSQAIVSDSRSKNQARRPSINDVVFRPTFDVSRYQLQHSDENSFTLELKSGHEEYGVVFDRHSGLVTRYSITNNGSPELDVWQIGSQQAGRIYLPRMLAHAVYKSGHIRSLHVTYIRKVSTDSGGDSPLLHSIPDHAVVADIRGEMQETAPRFVVSANTLGVDGLLEEVASKTTTTSKIHPTDSASGWRRLLVMANVVAILAIVVCLLFISRSK